MRMDGCLPNRSGNTTASDTAAANEDYSDTYSYDLNGNQITDAHTGAGGTVGTMTNTYNGDDQLTTSVVNGATTQYDYDPNGSQIDVKVNGVITTMYTYDVRNKMVGFSGSAGSATYVYDDAGNRVQETTGAATTYYLTDTQNPTGYVQPIEQRSSPTVLPSLTYLIGDRVFGQAAGGGTINYFLIDGHGSTIALVNPAATATHTIIATYAYTAYGDALNFTPATAGTVFLFGGDALYDPISGLYMHGDGTARYQWFLLYANGWRW